MKNQKKGFTLIELLVVIAIIGILSAIGLVALNGAREKARDAQRQSDLAQVRTALTIYFDSNNSTFPDAVGNGTQGPDCFLTGTPGAGTVWASGGPLITTYLGAQLTPPSAAYAPGYCYDNNTANTAYMLYTRLEGGTATGYWLNSDGASGTPAYGTGHTTNCEAQTSCNTW